MERRGEGEVEVNETNPPFTEGCDADLNHEVMTSGRRLKEDSLKH